MSIQDDLVLFLRSRLMRYDYTMDARRSDPENTRATDCSALMQYAFKSVAGIEIGSWTGAQQNYGIQVFGSECPTVKAAMELLRPADLVFFDWDGINISLHDHVDMYSGNGMLIGHGGPGKGPREYSLSSQWNYAHTITARRYVGIDENYVSNTPQSVSWPSWPLGRNEYFGDILGPNNSHGGYYEWERPLVKLIQQFLWDGGFVQRLNYSRESWCDGIFEQPTIDAVAAWQRQHMPGTMFYGQVWSDDWAKMREQANA